MTRTISQTEAARRDTLFTRAEGLALDLLSRRLYGLERPANYPRDAWAQMLRALVYQPRGTFRTVFAVFDALFSPWARLVTLGPVTVSATGVFASSTITTAHAGRWAWFEEAGTGARTLVWVRTCTPSVGGVLSTAETGYWRAWEQERTGSLYFLPFALVESDCEVTVLLDSELLSAPPTYLQDPAGAARAAGEPYGGALLNLFDLDPATLNYGDQVNGPFPLYLTGAEVGGLFGAVARVLLPAGVALSVRSAVFADTLGYGPIYALPRFGRVGLPSLGT